MSPDELNSALRREPFLPFRVHLSNGVHYEVRNPQMAAIGRTILFIGLTRDVDSPYFDEPVWVALRHITHIEPIVEAASGSGLKA